MILRIYRKIKEVFFPRKDEPWFLNAKQALQYQKDKFSSSINRPLIGVEVGAHLGNHCQRILNNLNIKKITLIDPWTVYEGDAEYFLNQKFQDECYQTVLKRFKNDNRVEILKSTSLDASRKFTNQSLDFVYIDGNHEYEYVIEDLKSWYPKVKYRGIIAGDDFKYKFPGVIRAVKEFAHSYNLNVELLDRGQFVILKTNPE
jgi:hypothetical protein